MGKLVKTSLNYYLSEYLADLQRAGVTDFYRPPRAKDAPKREPDEQSRAARPQAVVQAPSGSVDEGKEPPARQSERRPEPERVVVSDSEQQNRVQQLRVIAQDVAKCELCAELVANRTQTVFGTGDPCAELVFIGEGPGAEEDLRGEPFVGRSGQLLTDMIEKGMGIPRSSVFICNIVRCRPPQNRNPSTEEAKACRPFLNATLDVVRPKFICCLGSIAATNLLETTTPIGKLRGSVWNYRDAAVVCTYHPAYLLRNPSAKKQAWEDLQLLMREMGLPVKR